LLSFTGRLPKFTYSNAEDANRVIGFNSKEPLTLRVLKLIQEGDVVVDVGASMGIHAIPAALAVGKSGLVVAIEADKSKFNKLSKNVQLS